LAAEINGHEASALIEVRAIIFAKLLNPVGGQQHLYPIGY